MDDLNFTIPPPHPNLDTKIALKYFKAAGNTMDVVAGQTLFVRTRKEQSAFFKRDKQSISGGR